ncbi:MAG: methyltransferase domain-containing protein [Solirubrobacterales bacterium]|nr:methyltransferase domain-containing protein [Solirubrobacterales bacterium]
MEGRRRAATRRVGRAGALSRAARAPRPRGRRRAGGVPPARSRGAGGGSRGGRIRRARRRRRAHVSRWGRTHLTPDLLEFIRTWLPAPPASVIEVGCGDGRLTAHLRERGHRVIGIDPEAPEGAPFIATTLERFRTDDPFDAAVAIRSLHHVGDLPAAIDSLHAALRPRGRLVMLEFAVENVDDAARRWQAEVGLPETRTANMHDVIALTEVRGALGRRFRELAFEPGPYLAREAEREDLLGRELAAIEAGELRPVGARLAFDAIEPDEQGARSAR